MTVYARMRQARTANRRNSGLCLKLRISVADVSNLHTVYRNHRRFREAPCHVHTHKLIACVELDE